MPGVDRYFKKKLTGKIDENKTDLIIIPMLGRYDDSGSNEPTKEVQNIQISVYFGINSNANEETVKNSIVSFFVSNNWQVTYGPDWGTDPETGEDSLVFYFSRTIEREI